MESKGTTVVASCIHQALTDSHRYTTLTDATGMFLIPGPIAWVFIVLVALTLYVPFSLQVTLGQDYLPQHMSTASGVTLGLAVSVGGVATPLIGALADRVGLEYALLPLIALPAVAFIALWGLQDPSTRVVEVRN